MDTSDYLCTDKTIKSQVRENVIEIKNDPSTTNLDIINKNLIKNDNPSTTNLDTANKNLIVNDNHSNKIDKNTKAKKINEFENIKSAYIIKDIFSFLSTKQKLKIIIYNKYLQKKLDINNENYKRIRGIYREGERNGKGKEYYISTNLIIFEGEYKNGKRNGKGKEYSVYKDLLFEGEYLNGKRWNGKGKEYNNGELIFEGEYLNGERWNGQGKEYNYYGKLIFEGKYINGKKNGQGKEYNYYGKLIFEGEYLNGKKMDKEKNIIMVN